MGSLYEHKDLQLHELRETYNGVLMMLRHFISNDEYTEHHSYRVSVYAATIAAHLDLERRADRGRSRRGAAARHRQARHQPRASLQGRAVHGEEFARDAGAREKGVAILEPVGGSLRRVIPIVLSHHDKFDGSGYTRPGRGDPVEARIISVADVYDSLTSDRPYRKAMSPFEAREIIMQGSGTDFDPRSSTRSSWRTVRASSRSRVRRLSLGLTYGQRAEGAGAVGGALCGGARRAAVLADPHRPGVHGRRSPELQPADPLPLPRGAPGR